MNEVLEFKYNMLLRYLRQCVAEHRYVSMDEVKLILSLIEPKREDVKYE